MTKHPATSGLEAGLSAPDDGKTRTASSSDAGTTSAILNALADDVERAEGPSRELDARIRAALFVPTAEVEQSSINGAWCLYVTVGGKRRIVERPPAVPHEVWQGAYTASLDAAMTLAPDGVRRLIEQQTFKSGPNDPERSYACVSVFTAPLGELTGTGRAATPAQALTAAWLRARAVQS